MMFKLLSSQVLSVALDYATGPAVVIVAVSLRRSTWVRLPAPVCP